LDNTDVVYWWGLFPLWRATTGSYYLWVGVALHKGMVIPALVPLFRSTMIDFVAFRFMPKCFDWRHPIEQELLEDDTCIV
jgi:hypothetical protein